MTAGVFPRCPRPSLHATEQLSLFSRMSLFVAAHRVINVTSQPVYLWNVPNRWFSAFSYVPSLLLTLSPLVLKCAAAIKVRICSQ